MKIGKVVPVKIYLLPKRFHFGHKFDDATDAKKDALNYHPRQKEKNNHTNCEGKVDQIRKVAVTISSFTSFLPLTVRDI